MWSRKKVLGPESSSVQSGTLSPLVRKPRLLRSGREPGKSLGSNIPEGVSAGRAAAEMGFAATLPHFRSCLLQVSQCDFGKVT